MFEIRKYSTKYESGVMNIIEAEGQDWACYWAEPNRGKYKKALATSISYVALHEEDVCGYSRSMMDALYIYICDLLVTPACRGKQLGKKLMERVAAEYPDFPIYIMSGNDEYYSKLGYSKAGSVYLLK